MFKKLMFRKGQGISLNTIIIAAIALVVLVVIVAIFTGRLGIFSNKLDNKCTEVGGICAEDCENIGRADYALGNTECDPTYCCVLPELGTDQS